MHATTDDGLLTTAFLRAHGPDGLDLLESQYAIKARRHGRYSNLVLLKYSQIDSPMGDPLVQECRGLILDEDDWVVVAYPYRKFFNHGEVHASKIDWSTAQVHEKLDGSLMTMYWYDGWQVATSGTPDALGQVGREDMTFADLFWQTFADLGYRIPAPTCKLVFMFELCAPENRIVVPHAQRRLVLHGVRDLVTMQELPPETMAPFGWEIVRSFPLGTVDECLEAAKAINPMDCEGYVVRDAQFNRIKVKSPQYVALHHAKDGLTRRRMIEIARANEGAEFLAYFPELRADYDAVVGALQGICSDACAAYGQLAGLDSQKEFAIEATKTPYSSILFAMRAGKVATPADWMRGATFAAVERLVDARMEADDQMRLGLVA